MVSMRTKKKYHQILILIKSSNLWKKIFHGVQMVCFSGNQERLIVDREESVFDRNGKGTQ